MVTDDKFLLLKLHPCVEGLSDEVVREIADRCELLTCEPGEVLHRAYERLTVVYLVIHGRVKVSLIDIQGVVLMERQIIAGSQVGALAAASGEPSPANLEVMEPSRLLRLEYQSLFELTSKHELFRQNMAQLIACTVNQALMGERRKPTSRTIAFVHSSPATRPLTPRLLTRLLELGQSPFVVHDQPEWQLATGNPQFCMIQNGRSVADQEIREQLDKVQDRKLTLFDVDAATETSKLFNIFEINEKIFWCVTPETAKKSLERLAEIERRSPNWRDKVKIVWLLPGATPWAPTGPEWRSLATQDFKLSLDEPPEHRSRVLVQGLERIVHEIRGIRIGLALGGGAARGMAHLGVLQILEESGIPIDRIAGTSAGAMTGILYASGMSPQYSVESFVNDLNPPWFFRTIPNGGAWYLLYKYRRHQFDPMLRKYLKESRLEQLPIPVHSVTVDLISGQAIVRDEGDSVHAILESINLPVLSPPINRDGRSLVDGGIVNNVPANVLASQGCNFVIAVSVTAKIKQEFASNSPSTATSQMKTASALETILRTYVVQNVNMNSVGVQPADFVIQPDVKEFDSAAFSRADEMSEIGAQTTRESLPKLRELLSRLDDKLFQA